MTDLVLIRDDRKYGLIVAPGKHLHLTFIDHPLELPHQLGMMLFYPFQQYSGEMQADLEIRMSLENLQKRQIAVAVSIFKHVLEIADGLVIVNGKSEFDLFHETFRCIRLLAAVGIGDEKKGRPRSQEWSGKPDYCPRFGRMPQKDRKSNLEDAELKIFLGMLLYVQY